MSLHPVSWDHIHEFSASYVTVTVPDSSGEGDAQYSGEALGLQVNLPPYPHLLS